MMTEDYRQQLTPPPELVRQWAANSPVQYSNENWAYELFIAHRAARWGADQELEACCEWIRCPDTMHLGPDDLRAARRPKPPSLAWEAFDALRSAMERLDRKSTR